MNPILKKYAELLVNYCVELQAGEKLLVRTTTLAEPLVKAIYQTALEAGGIPVIELEFEEQNRLLLDYGAAAQLDYVSPLFKEAMQHFNAYIVIRAPFNLSEISHKDNEKKKRIRQAHKPFYQIYSKRTATRDMKRNLCLYPTHASAQKAGMSLSEYQRFVYNACYLFEDNPKDKWLEVRAFQQQIVDVLNQKEKIRYRNPNFDITFSTKGRTWINSDGQTNMPSGEVYTSPVEDAVDGVVHFDYPAIRMGEEIKNATLWVEKGEIVKWEAQQGQKILDSVFKIPGARRFGEAAIGTNTNINRLTKNMLFDEKIGGTIHMAIGQAYFQTGGKNQSAIHWDMITDMTNGGEIYADDELIYQNGQFLFI